MTNIDFVPENSSLELIKATKEYQKIWKKEGKRIIGKMEAISGLNFGEKEIKAIVFEGVSHSGRANVSPMKLRASYQNDLKKAALIHELGHRLLSGHGVKSKGLSSHQILYLILYDIWRDLYGKEFADQQVEIESRRKNPVAPYRESWQWALSKSRVERKKAFAQIIKEIAG